MSIKLLKYHRIRKSLTYSEIVNHRITLGIVITPNPQFQELLKYPQAQKLQNCPHSMKLSKCPCRSTVTRIWSTLARKLKYESSGHTESKGGDGDLPRAAMTPDRAPKVVSPSTAK